MIQAFIIKRIAGAIIKKVMAKRAIKNMQKYVEQENELDVKTRDLENANAILNKDKLTIVIDHTLTNRVNPSSVFFVLRIQILPKTIIPNHTGTRNRLLMATSWIGLPMI